MDRIKDITSSAKVINEQLNVKKGFGNIMWLSRCWTEHTLAMAFAVLCKRVASCSSSSQWRTKVIMISRGGQKLMWTHKGPRQLYNWDHNRLVQPVYCGSALTLLHFIFMTLIGKSVHYGLFTGQNKQFWRRYLSLSDIRGGCFTIYGN